MFAIVRRMERMDDQQRARAGAAVAEAMEAKGLTAEQLARQSGVAAGTIRDLCSGKRWPWTSKRNAIELQLEWPTGRIAQIAKGNADAPPNEDNDFDVSPLMRLSELEALVADPTRGLPVREALAALLECSPLSEARQAKVVAFYLDMIEDQDRRGGSVPTPRDSDVV